MKECYFNLEIFGKNEHLFVTNNIKKALNVRKMNSMQQNYMQA